MRALYICVGIVCFWWERFQAPKGLAIILAIPLGILFWIGLFWLAL